MAKNIVFGLVAFTALLVSPATFAPAGPVVADETSITVDYSSMSFSSSGGAPLN